MTAMYHSMMNMTADATCAPACRSAHSCADNCIAMMMDTAMMVVSILHIIVAMIVRIIMPQSAKP